MENGRHRYRIVETFGGAGRGASPRDPILQVADSDVPSEIALPTSKQVIASRLNLTPETLSRIFHDLSDAGLISVQGKRITLHDPARLSRYNA